MRSSRAQHQSFLYFDVLVAHIFNERNILSVSHFVVRILCLHVLVAQMFNERIIPARFNKSSAQIIATIRQSDMPTKLPEPYAQFYRRSDLNSFGTALRRTLNREMFSSQVQALTGCTIVPLPPAIIAYRTILSPVR